MHAMSRLWLAGGWSGANFDESTAQSVLGLNMGPMSPRIDSLADVAGVAEAATTTDRQPSAPLTTGTGTARTPPWPLPLLPLLPPSASLLLPAALISRANASLAGLAHQASRARAIAALSIVWPW